MKARWYGSRCPRQKPRQTGPRLTGNGLSILKSESTQMVCPIVCRDHRNPKPLVKGKWLQHLLEDWAPALPFSVLALAVKLGLTDEQLRHFRPIRATYWG